MVFNSIPEIFTEINSSRKRLCEGLPELNLQQATFKPSPEAWSISEILEHLAKVDRALVTRIDKLVAELEEAGTGATCTSFFPFSMDSIAERARDQKFKSPEPVLPVAGLSIQESIAKLQASRADLVAMQPRIEARDLSKTTFPHFVFGQLNIYQWLAFFGLHENRHRKQIDRLMASPEFPT
ncbi:MAG TPA: DinB family protein [Candidatus Angelobacter sp.]|jgi:uncharacterized damage-inducible protein DinB|nr:DinB family protein [Candidatus Angelobacter sp.]